MTYHSVDHTSQFSSAHGNCSPLTHSDCHARSTHSRAPLCACMFAQRTIRLLVSPCLAAAARRAREDEGVSSDSSMSAVLTAVLDSETPSLAPTERQHHCQ